MSLCIIDANLVVFTLLLVGKERQSYVHFQIFVFIVCVANHASRLHGTKWDADGVGNGDNESDIKNVFKRHK